MNTGNLVGLNFFETFFEVNLLRPIPCQVEILNGFL